MRASWLALLLLIVPELAQAETCPSVMNDATRLALVTANGMNTSAATLALYSRDNGAAPWKPLGTAQPVTLGERGMAWGTGFTQLARRGEPVKNEHDRRTPA